MLERPRQTQTRHIRVFISSTFRDMQAERDLLVKKVFPQVRKMCEERSVVCTEVDLRWGITTEQAAEGKVLPLCLEEIQRCRPFFIGLLGERYGWVPSAIPADLIQVQPWLLNYPNRSVTELEILHGVFGAEKVSGHSYFYFRNRDYVERSAGGERNQFEAESADAITRLENLKQKIRDSQTNGVYSLRENYSGPEELCEWILEDFTKLIDRLYPKEATPDALDQEAARHEAHARSRRNAFIGRDDLINRLNQHAIGTGHPLVLTGESGCGKSALLAEWVHRWRESNPDDFVLQHYVGSTSHSADWQGVVRRIVGELKRAFDLEGDIPNDDNALRLALNEWAGKVAGRKRIVLVVDALDQLADEGGALKLGWLPTFFPNNFRVVVSSLTGPGLDVLSKRRWSGLEVPVFTENEVGSAATAYFQLFSKAPSSEMIDRLQSTAAARNPLYLRAVLDELRQFGRLEELQKTTETYLSARGPAELFDLILTRWEQDFDQAGETPRFIRNALCLIACSRFGLSEAELLDLLAQGEHPMPHRHWAPFYLAAENALSQNAGLLRFGHQYLRRAVESRWLKHSETKKAYRLVIANYFARRELGPRTAAELPWQLKQSAENDRLRATLNDLNLALEILDRFPGELLGYWVWLGEERSIGKVYVDLVRSTAQRLRWPTETTSSIATKIADFLTDAAVYPQAEELYRYALKLDEEISAQPGLNTATKLIKLSDLLVLTSRTMEGEAKLLRAIEILDAQSNKESVLLIRALLSLATAQEARGELAQSHCRRALSIAEEHYGSRDPLVATCLAQLGEHLMMHSIRFTETDLMYRSERKDIRRYPEAEPLFRRALAIHEEVLGSNDIEVAKDLHRLSICLTYGNQLLEADRYIRRAMVITENALGPKHPYKANLLSAHAVILQGLGREEAGANARQNAEKIHEDIRKDLGIVAALNAIIPGISDMYKGFFATSFAGRWGVKLTYKFYKRTGRPIPTWIEDLIEYHRLEYLLVEEKKSTWQMFSKVLSIGLSLLQVLIHLVVVFFAIIQGLATRTLKSILLVVFTLAMHMAQVWGIIIVDLFWAYRWWPSGFARIVLVVTILFTVLTIKERSADKKK